MSLVGTLLEVILYVEDMGAQTAFYRDTLGFRVKEPEDVEDLRSHYWVALDTGSCTLALHGGGQRRFGADAPKIVFRVDNVARVREELLGSGVPMNEIRVPASGLEVCDGADPEGNRFSIESRTAM